MRAGVVSCTFWLKPNVNRSISMVAIFILVKVIKSGKIRKAAIFFCHNFFILFPFHEEYVTWSLMGQQSQINMDHKPCITMKYYYLIKVEKMKNVINWPKTLVRQLNQHPSFGAGLVAEPE